MIPVADAQPYEWRFCITGPACKQQSHSHRGSLVFLVHGIEFMQTIAAEPTIQQTIDARYAKAQEICTRERRPGLGQISCNNRIEHMFLLCSIVVVMCKMPYFRKITLFLSLHLGGVFREGSAMVRVAARFRHNA